MIGVWATPRYERLHLQPRRQLEAHDREWVDDGERGMGAATRWWSSPGYRPEIVRPRGAVSGSFRSVNHCTKPTAIDDTEVRVRLRSQRGAGGGRRTPRTENSRSMSPMPGRGRCDRSSPRGGWERRTARGRWSTVSLNGTGIERRVVGDDLVGLHRGRGVPTVVADPDRAAAAAGL